MGVLHADREHCLRDSTLVFRDERGLAVIFHVAAAGLVESQRLDTLDPVRKTLVTLEGDGLGCPANDTLLSYADLVA